MSNFFDDLQPYLDKALVEHSLVTDDCRPFATGNLSISFDEIEIELPEFFTSIAIIFFQRFIARYFDFNDKESFTQFSEHLPALRKTVLTRDNFLSDISPKDKLWDRHREACDKVADLYNAAGYERYFERLQKCSTFLQFKKVVDGNKLKLHAAHFCRHRHCTVCQWRRTLMWTARFLRAIPLIQHEYPTHRYIFLTLTVRNCNVLDLKETIQLMNKAWEKLARRKVFPGVGYIRSLEVTRGKDGSAHPHFHCLLMVPSGYFGKSGGYLSQKQWVKLWQDCLGIDYEPVLDVQAVKPKSEASLTDALREVLKYSVKEDDLVNHQDWLIAITSQLYKTRAISLGGIFKNYLSEDDPKDYINDEQSNDLEEITGENFYFDWRKDYKRYTSRKKA